ncbi:MAG TPA: SDR family oxidoreductase [Flavipsychrobacter sp.]|nr:SDR family oxidoreductase [Flavipsychrobacter sp.]
MNILITGGSSGVGRAITESFAGTTENKVYFTFNSSVENAGKIEKQFPNTQAFQCDFNDNSSVENLLNNMAELDLDVLVNNAHTKYTQQHFYKIAAEDFLKDFQLNVVPTLLITQKAIAIFRKKKFGKIINIISSAVINKPPAGMSVYTAQKNYLLSMSKSWATEGIRFNITSNCISPAFMATHMTEDYDERTVEQIIEAHPLKQLLNPKDVAEAVLYLAQATQHINGTNMVMNAGSDMV